MFKRDTVSYITSIFLFKLSVKTGKLSAIGKVIEKLAIKRRQDQELAEAEY